MQDLTQIVVQVLGWVGSFLIVLAYFLVSRKKVSGASRKYQLINLFGAIGVGINVLHQHAWPALALEIIWAVIALATLLKGKRSETV
ncbi:MAG: hypothetical protein PHU56_03660 [Candidatus Pacebacteria bacterium]|nr:hypothetical protein [Candidatus Paceibacterota bacterium]